jgi:hypothetical protein
VRERTNEICGVAARIERAIWQKKHAQVIRGQRVSGCHRSPVVDRPRILTPFGVQS